MRNYKKVGEMPGAFSRIFEVVKKKCSVTLIKEIYSALYANHYEARWVDRIKTCPMCRQVFWKGKLNALTCGNKKCINDFQNQKKKVARSNFNDIPI